MVSRVEHRLTHSTHCSCTRIERNMTIFGHVDTHVGCSCLSEHVVDTRHEIQHGQANREWQDVCGRQFVLEHSKQNHPNLDCFWPNPSPSSSSNMPSIVVPPPTTGISSPSSRVFELDSASTESYLSAAVHAVPQHEGHRHAVRRRSTEDVPPVIPENNESRTLVCQ